MEDDPEVLAMWRAAITPEKHKHSDSDIVTISHSDGRQRQVLHPGPSEAGGAGPPALTPGERRSLLPLLVRRSRRTWNPPRPANPPSVERPSTILSIERRLGELVNEQKRTVGLASGGEHGGRKKKDGSRKEPSNARPTLAECGMQKRLGDDPG